MELLSIQDGAVRLRIQANGHGCGSKPEALREIVESAMLSGRSRCSSLLIEDARRPDLVQIGVFAL